MRLLQCHHPQPVPSGKVSRWTGGIHTELLRMVQCNNRISVYNDMGSDIGDVLMILQQFGIREFEDFAMLDTVDSEMWC